MLDRIIRIVSIEKFITFFPLMFNAIKSWFQQPPPPAKVERPKLPDRLGRTEALLDPDDQERGLLFERIYTKIYRGVDDRSEREQILLDQGYDPEKLSKQGKNIRERLMLLLHEMGPGDGNQKQQQEFHDLSSVVFTSKSGGRHKEHTSLSIGLAAQLRHQMRKLLKVELEINEDKKVEAMGEEAPSYRREDLLALDELLRNNQSAVEGRFQDLLAGLTALKQKQYQSAWKLLYGELKGGASK